MRRKTQTKLGKGLRSLRSFSPGIISILGLVGLIGMVAMAPVVSEWKVDNAFADDGCTHGGWMNIGGPIDEPPTSIEIDGQSYMVISGSKAYRCDGNDGNSQFYKYTLADGGTLIYNGATNKVCTNFNESTGECDSYDPISTSSLDLSLSSDTLNLSSTNADGSGFVSASVTSSVTSTAAGGYNLYMSASGKDQSENYTASLVNANDKQYTIGTLPANGSIDLSFSTSDGNRAYANTSSFTANKWAYSVQDLTGKTDAEISSLSGTNTFKAIPLDETVINTTSADSTTSSTAINTLNGETSAGAASTRVSNIYTKNSASGAANDGSAPDNVEVTIAARTDNTIPAGNYTNTLVFTVIGIDYSGVIVYDPNGEVGDGTSAGTDGTTTVGGDMSMVTHTNVASGDSVNLYAPNYWRKGYGFAGWSEDKDAASKLANGESVTVYGPNETITAPSTISSAGMRLYATWIKSAGDMQGWSGCSSMSTGSITALTDTRDNNTYAIAKLADNKCWVVENYRLASGAVDSTNTNNPVANFAWTESSNSWCATDSSVCDNQVLINTNNINSSLAASPTTNNSSSSWYGYGVNYNWYTATAGNGTYEKSSGNVSGDICPSGWHLPTSTSTGELQAMYTAIGKTPANIRKYPNNFVLSGFWYGSSTGNRGSLGYYWSSTAYSNNSAYNLDFSSSYVNPSYDLGKTNGFSVRCIAGAQSNTIVYSPNGADGGDMSSVTHTGVANGAEVTLIPQNYWRSGYGFAGWSTDPQAASKIGTANAATIYGPGETIKASDNMDNEGMFLYAVWVKSAGNMQGWKGCSSMSVGDVTALTDTRDGNTYAVAKLADGKCWMSENLRLSSGTVNSSTTHNPISNFAWAASTNSWCTNDNATCDNKVIINTNNLNSSLTASPTTNNNSSSWYGYGTYYNWYTATAGNGTYEKSSGNVSGDICPADWHLPTSTSSGEFQAMYTAIGATPANIRKYPNNFVLSGLWNGSSTLYRGPYGYYWSSTAYNILSAYGLSLNSSSVDPSNFNRKFDGRSVRCIAG